MSCEVDAMVKEGAVIGMFLEEARGPKAADPSSPDTPP
jgi:hypothetical protein